MPKSIWSLALLIFAPALAQNEACAENTAEAGFWDYVQEANCLIKAGQTGPGLEATRAALRLAPQDAAAFANLAALYDNLDRYQPALVAASQALRLEPANPRHWADRGQIYFGQGEYAAAEIQFKKASGLEPTNPSWLLSLANMRLEQKKFPETIATYQQIIALKPREFTAWNNLAESYRQAGDPAQAVAIAQKALAQNPPPGDVAALNNIMGLSYHDLDQPQQALAALNRAVELAPENLAYREHRAAVALMAEEPELAQADLEPVLAQEPQNSELRRLHALASMDARDLEAAKNDLQILVESPGATGTDYYNLAAVYLALQEPKAALPHLSRALKLDPLEAEAFKLRGFIYYKNGELDTALQDLERYLELAYQPDPEVSRVVAELESKLGL